MITCVFFPGKLFACFLSVLHIHMFIEFGLGVMHNITLVTRILVGSREVHILNVPQRVPPPSAFFSTLGAFVLSHLCSLNDPHCVLHEMIFIKIFILLKCSQKCAN